MSAQKMSGDSLSVKEAKEPLDHLPTFSASATTDDPSFPPQSLFNSLHDGGRTHGDLHVFARDRQLYREPSCHNHGEGASNVPNKWMPSKMRLMRKMMGSDQIPVNKPRRRMPSPPQDRAVLNQEMSNGNISTSCIVRVCSDCNTTKTPLWRSGPHGPKSLCNACGIRQMKARRASMAASVTSTRKEKNSAVDRTVPYKKRYKFTNHGDDHLEKLAFKDPLIQLSRSSSPVFHPTFPQDDKDAAILLMTLSCDMIHGQVL